jgi:hypothetical protein
MVPFSEGTREPVIDDATKGGLSRAGLPGGNPVDGPEYLIQQSPAAFRSIFPRDASQDPEPKEKEGEGEVHGLVHYELCYSYNISFVHME